MASTPRSLMKNGSASGAADLAISPAKKRRLKKFEEAGDAEEVVVGHRRPPPVASVAVWVESVISEGRRSYHCSTEVEGQEVRRRHRAHRRRRRQDTGEVDLAVPATGCHPCQRSWPRMTT